MANKDIKNNNDTMQLWEKEYIKSLGLGRIENAIDFINGDLSLTEYDKITHEYTEQFQPFTDTSAQNYESGFLYDNAAQSLLSLCNIYNNTLDSFNSNNSDVTYILGMIITSETRIEGEIEYNKLLDAIPEEARGQIPVNLLKRKDIEKSIDTLPCLEYALKVEERKGRATTDMLENPIYLYARMMFIQLIFKTIYKTFNITKRIELKDPIKNNDDFETVVRDMAKVFIYGEERIKDFGKTIFYKRFNHYRNIDKVIEKQEYKQEAEKQEKVIQEMLSKQIKGEEILIEIERNLFKQGWWFIDE